MEHLTPETLARLVDNPPSPGEERHLEACAYCQGELRELRDQTRALGQLPHLQPPRGGWERLEGALREESLLRRETSSPVPHPPGETRSPTRFPERRRSPGWLQAAAAILLLLGGGALGMGASTFLEGPTGPVASGEAPAALPADEVLLAALDPERAGADLSLEEAEELVRLTEGWYLTALNRYRDQALREESSPDYADPITRFAALETLLAASQAAVREAPADPFLNGLLVNMRAERDWTLQGLQASSASLNWY